MKTKFFVLGFLYLFFWLLTAYAIGSFAATNSIHAIGSATVAFDNNSAAIVSITSTESLVTTPAIAGPAVKYLISSSNYLPAAGTAVIITAQLVDENNTPVTTSGLILTWSKSNINGIFATATSTTNANGIATVVFTTHTTAATATTITGTDAGSLTGTSAIITTKAGAPAKYLVSAETYFPIAGSPVTITAQLADINNNPVSIPGISVTWSKSDANGSFSPAFNTTDGNGVVTTVFTTHNRAATATTITATCTGFTGTSPTITTVAGAAAKYMVSSSNYSPVAGSPVTITAQLSDTNGNAIHTPGIAVTWSKSNINGSFVTTSSTTDGNGLATVVFTTHSIGAIASTITATDAGSVTGTSAVITTIADESPADVSLALVPLYENQAPGSLAGLLSSTSNGGTSSFTYTLVSGSGDIDNTKFKVSNSEVITAESFDYEKQQSYHIRVRSTSQPGLSLDKTFVIQIIDINEAPAFDAIANQSFCHTTSEQVIMLTGITAGPENGQSVTTSVSTDNLTLFQSLNVKGNKLSYSISAGQSGKATLIVKLKDDGGTANGGVDEANCTFSITVAPQVQADITSDKGSIITKGETVQLTATGGNSYQWSDNQGIISGQHSARLLVRPMKTTNYEVQVTNTSGCITTQRTTIEVKEDFTKIWPANNFSPNSDQINDTWQVENIDAYPDHKLIIFDRGGRILYTTRNYRNEWDGMMNGSRLDEGTYYYVFQFDKPGITPLKGFISIVH